MIEKVPIFIQLADQTNTNKIVRKIQRSLEKTTLRRCQERKLEASFEL